VEKSQSFKYRIDPTPAQQQLLWSTIGGSRFAYVRPWPMRETSTGWGSGRRSVNLVNRLTAGKEAYRNHRPSGQTGLHRQLSPTEFADRATSTPSTSPSGRSTTGGKN